MAFTDEARVRNHLGGIGSEFAESTLIQQAIQDAHTDILRDLKDEYVHSSDASLERAETELASAGLLRMLAGRVAVSEQEVQTRMLKVLPGNKVEDLYQRAKQEEKRARGRLKTFSVNVEKGFAFGLVRPDSALSGEDG